MIHKYRTWSNKLTKPGYVWEYDQHMNTSIVSTTDLQRNIKNVLSRLKSSNEPMVVVRDSIPTAVLLPFSEYKTLTDLEKQILMLPGN